MDKQPKDLDNFLKENLSGIQRSNNPGNWESFNHLLKEQQRKNKRKKIFIYFFIFIGIVSIGLVFLEHNKEGKQNTNVNTEKSNSYSSNENKLRMKAADRPAKRSSSGNNENKNNSSRREDQAKNKEEAAVWKQTNNTNVSMNVNVSDHLSRRANGIVNGAVKTKVDKVLVNEWEQVQFSDTHKTDAEKINSESLSQIQSVAEGNKEVNENISTTAITDAHVFSSDAIPGKLNSDTSVVTTENKLVDDSSTTQKLNPAKLNVLNFNIYAGINIYTASSSFTSKEKISPLAGLELSHPLSAKFTVGLAGLYSVQGGYHLADTATKESYFLEKNISEQTIQIHQLHKVYFPLTLYYVVSKRHSVLVAIQLAYLINTNGNYTEAHHSSSGDTNEQKENVKGYTKGIKTTNMGASLGYQFKVSKRVDVSSRITRELTSEFTKEYFYGVNAKPAWSFQAFLIYNF